MNHEFEIKSCPFCGGEGYIRDNIPRGDYKYSKEDDLEDPERYCAVVTCRCCAAEGSWYKGERRRRGAIKRWNERHCPACIAAEKKARELPK